MPSLENHPDAEEPEEKGIACPRCGCRDLRVVTTVPRLKGIVRYRECRHCGKRLRTTEEARGAA